MPAVDLNASLSRTTLRNNTNLHQITLRNKIRHRAKIFATTAIHRERVGIVGQIVTAEISAAIGRRMEINITTCTKQQPQRYTSLNLLSKLKRLVHQN